MPQSLRSEFKKAYGRIYSSVSSIAKDVEGKAIVAIGDRIGFNLLQNKIKPKVLIIDHKENNKSISREMMNTFDKFSAKEYRVSNPSGGVTQELWDAIKEALVATGKSKIIVNGEEDMAFLPAILECNEGDIVMYGFFDKGFVLTEVNNDLKKKMKFLLSKFEGS